MHRLAIDVNLPLGVVPFPLRPDIADFSAAFAKQIEWELLRVRIEEHHHLDSALRLEMLKEDLVRVEREIEAESKGEKAESKDEPPR